MRIKAVEDTALFKALTTGYEGDDKLLANDLAVMVKNLCAEAGNRMKKCITLHSQYTLHDDVHLFRVAELMARILGQDMINNLNPIEIAVLILSAYYHDIGMIMDDKDIKELETNEDYIQFKANWIIEHPNYKETLSRLHNLDENPTIIDNASRVRAELEKALLTDYIRISHAILSKNYILMQDNMCSIWKFKGYSLADVVAKICISHCMNVRELAENNGYYVDENISSYKINTIYLSIVLRLSDILDFDRERTPDSIYRSIHFTNEVSLNEWEKHRAITGWEISDRLIRFTAQCTHPVYQRAIFTFIDWIDNELNNCHNLIAAFPISAQVYKLNLPRIVDRSRINPKNNLYIYHDLEFTLSRDEVVKLLMMDDLYNTPSLCVRELLQNSLDALRHRKTRVKNDMNVDWLDGSIELTHSLDEYGREVLTCVDNGMGMDEKIIENYLTNAGKSYYKSAEFEHEKALFYSKGIGFEPCSQFGIGFMSCFMVGDLITIKTRKDYGDGKPYGRPLLVEISGLNGIIAIREGEQNQPIGTTISITGREKPGYFDEWVDIIRLTDVIEGYALACEFPIKAKCSIEETASEIFIPAGCQVNKTFIEEAKLPSKCYTTYEQELADIHPDVHGKLRLSLLTNEFGQLTLGNEVASWIQDEDNNKRCKFVTTADEHNVYPGRLTASCCDGILVCGKPGQRQESVSHLGWWANMIDAGLESFIIDFRNSVRPRLPPSRIAKDDRYNKHTSWEYAQDIVDRARGKLWERVLESTTTNEEIVVFIIIATICRFPLNLLPPKLIREKLLLPILDDGEYRWIKISSVNEIVVSNEDGKAVYSIGENQVISADDDTSKYDNESYGINVYNNIINALMCIVALDIHSDSKLIYHVLDPSTTKYPTGLKKIDSHIFRTLLLPYWDSSNKFIAIVSHFNNININHPIAVYTRDKLYLREENSLVDFFIAFSYFINERTNFDDIRNGKVSRTMRRIGCKYKLVDWSNMPDDYKPDYYVFIQGFGEFILSEEQFLKWANTKIEHNNKDEY